MRHLIAILLLACCAPHTMNPVAADPDPVPTVEIDASMPDYDRKEWGRWWDADKDCQDTRQEVLIRDSRDEVTYTDEKKCRVATGRWIDPYGGREVTNPNKLDIDHIVALRDAHDSGAWGWDKDQRKTFANDLSNLKASHQSMNRSKGARGPDEWLPPLATARCGYIKEWVGIKEVYGLGMAEAEYAVVTYMLTICSADQAPVIPQG